MTGSTPAPNADGSGPRWPTCRTPTVSCCSLVAWEGLTSTEAAAALGISPVAARSRLHRARRRALKALQDSAAADPADPMC